MKKVRLSGKFVFDFDQEVEISDSTNEAIDNWKYTYLTRNKVDKEIYEELCNILEFPDNELPDTIDIDLIEELDD